ncbi:hypothetical protein DBV15_11420, partial [Temnothorax longispinosus]
YTMHHTQPLRCVVLRSGHLICGIARTYECIFYTYYCKSGVLATGVRVYMWCIPDACCTWLEGETFYEVRRRDGGGARRRMVGSWMEAKVCEAGKLRAVFCFAAF